MAFLDTLNKAVTDGEIPEKLAGLFKKLYDSYMHSMQQVGAKPGEHDSFFEDFLKLTKPYVWKHYPFEPYHQKIVAPFNYFQFGVEFFRPLMDKERSRIVGLANLDKMAKQLADGENVVLFANHQTEADPQLMSLILEDAYPKLGEEVIFVAGDRVLTDPMAVPFSMGRNLLCIYSKRHVDHPPEKKAEKLLHNQRTMNRMKEILCDGGRFIYVAPSGGRDRANAAGEVNVADFDPGSIEMFRLMAKQATKAVHFYPLSLVTFDIMPPPPSVESELGETRQAKREGALFAFGDEIDMEAFPGADLANRHAKREARALYIWNLVSDNYHKLKADSNR